RSAPPLSLTPFPTRRSSDLNWMTERDRPAIHVQLRRVDLADRFAAAKLLAAELRRRHRPLARQHLRRERLVDLDQAHVCKLYPRDRKSTRLNSSHDQISYAV